MAVDQGGVISRRQLLDAGLSKSAIERARGSGRLFEVHPRFGVYSIMPPELLGEEPRIEAALLALGADATVAVGTAAFRLELIPAPPSQIELIVRDHHLEPDGVSVRRSPNLRPGDLTHDGRFPITTVPRTLLDLSVNYQLTPLLRALAEAEFHHAITPADVLRILRRGHRGSAKLRKALDLHVPGYGRAKSRLERRFRALLIEHGIPLPLRNQLIGRYCVDCYWPEYGLVVELDHEQHRRPHQAAVDAERDLELRALGLEVRRYSNGLVYDRPADVVADLRKRTNRE